MKASKPARVPDDLGWSSLDFFSFRLSTDGDFHEVLRWAGLVVPTWTQVEIRLAFVAHSLVDGAVAPISALVREIPAKKLRKAFRKACRNAGFDDPTTELADLVFDAAGRLAHRRNDYAHLAWCYHKPRFPKDLLLFPIGEVIRMKAVLRDRVQGRDEFVSPVPGEGLIITRADAESDVRAMEACGAGLL